MKRHNLNLAHKLYSEKELEENTHLFDLSDWINLCFYQKISESFIEKHKDKVCWRWVSFRQNLSDVFIRKHFDKIIYIDLMKNKNISDEIKKEIEFLKEII